jgi:hypothetical protein
MLNWAVGREYLDRTPFRRGTEVLIRMKLEDNKRRRRISESEEVALLAVRYDNQRLEALQAAVERLEGGKTFDPKIDASDNLSAVAVSTGSAKAEVSRVFQDPTEQSFAPSEDPAKESATSH